MTSVSGGLILLTTTQPVESGRGDRTHDLLTRSGGAVHTKLPPPHGSHDLGDSIASRQQYSRLQCFSSEPSRQLAVPSQTWSPSTHSPEVHWNFPSQLSESVRPGVGWYTQGSEMFTEYYYHRATSKQESEPLEGGAHVLDLQACS